MKGADMDKKSRPTDIVEELESRYIPITEEQLSKVPDAYRSENAGKITPSRLFAAAISLCLLAGAIAGVALSGYEFVTSCVMLPFAAVALCGFMVSIQKDERYVTAESKVVAVTVEKVETQLVGIPRERVNEVTFRLTDEGTTVQASVRGYIAQGDNVLVVRLRRRVMYVVLPRENKAE